MKTPQGLLVLLFIAVLGCQSNTQKEEALTTEKISTDWETASLEEAGFDENTFKNVLATAFEKNSKLDGLVIARKGKLVYEKYFNGFAADKPHKVWSVTKMVSGTVLGIAIDKGLLSEKDSIYKHLGSYTIDSSSTARGITVEHLITMTSGYAWNEMGGQNSAGFRLPYSKNWIDFVLSQPLTQAPGEVFNYSTGNSLLLAPIIRNVTGQQAADFAKEHLFTSLNIETYKWFLQSEFWTKQQGGEIPNIKAPKPIDYDSAFAALTNTGSGLMLLPRDMCKLGQLYLDSGVWDGKQIISKSWVAKSIQPHFNNKDYGYHWRLMTFEGYPCYYATGFRLQRVFVFPTLDMVVVTTQSNYTTMPKGNKLTLDMLKGIIGTLKN